MSVQDALNTMGIDHHSSGNDWGIAKCPLHYDSSPSLSINYERGTWKCFAGCGQGTIEDLAVLMVQKGYSFNFAQVRRELKGLGDPMAVEHAESDVDKVLSKLQEDKRNRPIDTKVLNGYLPYSKHIKARGISPYVADKHGIGFDMVNNRITIPIRDHLGLLIGIEARNLEGKPKYSPIIACDKSNWLWGAWLVPYGEPIVVFEGALGAARAETLGIRNVTALLGSSHSKGQVRRMLQAEHVIIALDPDKAGFLGAWKLFNAIYTSVGCRVVTLPMDIDEIDSRQLKEAIEKI